MDVYKVDSNMNLIQNIRCVQALMEINRICIRSEYNYIFEHLNRAFDTEIYKPYCNNLDEEMSMDQLIINIDHENPIIRINDREWILLFPRLMLTNLRSQWETNREIVSFDGILTLKRFKFFRYYFKARMPIYKRISFTIIGIIILQLSKFFINKIKYTLMLDFSNYKIRFSNNGRIFPIKAWDQEYYNRLLKSKYVLCPNGDFIWTYRFYECIICGAVPVVENECNAYLGFKYLTIDDYLNGNSLSIDDIHYNFNKINDEFTISQLNDR